MKIGLYTIKNWTIEERASPYSDGFSRKVLKNNRQCATIFVGRSKNNKEKYSIFFSQIDFSSEYILFKEYKMMFPQSSNFDSVQEAKDRVDLFLDKLIKLGCFM